MDGMKLIFALVVAGSTAVAPAYAKTSDKPAFGVWFAQWAINARQISNERLPCLRAEKGACTAAFSSSVAGNRAAKRKGRVDPFSRPKHKVRSTRRQVVIKNAARVAATGGQASGAVQGLSAFASAGRFLVLNETGNNMLGINLDQPGDTPPTQVDALGGFVQEVQQDTPIDETLLTDATGGVGGSAFVALYDFEDEGATLETQRGFQEIPSVLGARLALGPTSVPEPSSLLLVGAGLLALRLGAGDKRANGGLLQPKS